MTIINKQWQKIANTQRSNLSKYKETKPADRCCCCRPHSTNVLPAESSTRNHVAASSLSFFFSFFLTNSKPADRLPIIHTYHPSVIWVNKTMIKNEKITAK